MDEDETNTNHLINQNYARPEEGSSAFSKKRQITAAVVATLGCFLNGCVIGYTGPAIPSLTSSEDLDVYGSPLELEMQEASWVTSVLSIGCFIGCILAGPVMERIGRKRALMWVSAGNYALGFGLILLANSAVQIYIGRFLNGVGLGFVLAVVSVYIVEIATTDMRGVLGCFVQFQGSVGVLFTFCVGSLLNWWQLAVVHLFLVLPIVIAMYFIPESPRWLILKGNEWEGEVALKWLRGRDPQGLDREIDQIKREIAVRKRERVSITLLLEPEVIKPFLVSLMMMFFLQLSGFNIMVFYCVTIFQLAGSTIQPNVASIIVGVILLISCFVSLGVVSRLNRKVMLVLSILGMGVCHITLGGCYYYHTINQAMTPPLFDNETTAALLNSSLASPVETEGVMAGLLGWLPLLAVVGFLFLGNVGYGTLIWVVTAELLPPKVRSVANSFIISFAFITGFLVAKTFVDLVQSIGLAYTFWMYGAICVLGTLCTMIFVPETKDRSIEDIQEHFRPKSVKQPVRDEHPLETVT